MFQPEEVRRDEDGFWLHSAFNDAEEEDITKLPISEGMEFRFIGFFDDAPKQLQDRHDAASALYGATEEWGDVIREWEPTKPQGEGWFLAGIYDTEDGPYACFTREKQRSADEQQ
jgi:hypothetical protein